MSGAYLYRPGRPFSSEELQILLKEGVLRHVIEDVYVPGALHIDPQVRLLAIHRMLTEGIDARGVVCGESAAWVLIGGPPPERLTLITDGFHRRRPKDYLDWQLHQVDVAEEDLVRIGRIPVTSPLRTAEDLFMGIGTVGSRRVLDAAVEHLRGGLSIEARTWPARDRVGTTADQRLEFLHQTDEDAVRRRWKVLSRLLRVKDVQIDQDRLIARIAGRISRTRSDPARTRRVAETVDQCASRRFPTVR